MGLVGGVGIGSLYLDEGGRGWGAGGGGFMWSMCVRTRSVNTGDTHMKDFVTNGMKAYPASLKNITPNSADFELTVQNFL